MNTVVARLGRLETAYFEATRGPADPGVVDSANVTTPSSLVQSAVGAGFSLDAARGGRVPSAHQLNVRADPSPQTVFDYVDSPPCGDAPSVQLYKPSATVDSDGAAFALEGHSDADVDLDGDGAPPSLAISDDDTPALKIHAFVRRLFVRFRLRGESEIADYHAFQSHVLIAVRSWYVPAPPGSKSSTQHLAAARVIAGFVQRDVIKWLLARRRLSRRHAVRLVQKWFRAVRFMRRALYAFEPFVTRQRG